jgi:meso-butanediol dehydrogenase / (S,S)-butanediol dehydrogenase / diacetyl reductase
MMDERPRNYSRGPVTGRLADKVVVVTGAGGGLGQDAAILFAQAGAKVVASDISAAGVEATQRVAQGRGLTIDMSPVDAADEAAVQNWVSDAVARHHKIDALYNNAAGTRFALFGEMSLQDWRETLRLELDIVFIPTRAVWPNMVAGGGGSIINIASVSGMRGTEAIGAAAHATGKSGVIGFTRQVALEGAPYWIRCNSISPGPMVTPATQPILEVSAEFKRQFEGWPLLSRTGRPADISYAGLFLASDESAFITGTNLVVDGGWSKKGGFTPH